jgi:hypothetical protein
LTIPALPVHVFTGTLISLSYRAADRWLRRSPRGSGAAAAG